MRMPLGVFGAASAPSLEIETRNFLARCSPALSFATALALNSFIHEGKRSGWWYTADFIYLFATETQQAALLNIVDTTLPATAVNSPGFGQYLGFQGDGLTSYVSPGVANPSTQLTHYTQDNSAMFVGAVAESSKAAWAIGAAGTNQMGVRVKFSTNAAFLANVPAAASDLLAVSSSIGLTGWVRTDSTGYTVFKNGASKTVTRASSGVPTGVLNILRFGSGVTYDTALIDSVFVGRMTVAQAASYNQARADYLNALGTNPYAPIPQPALPAALAPSLIHSVNPASIQEVYMQVAPPQSDAVDNTTYAWFPLNCVDSGDITDTLTSTCTTVKAAQRLWGCRNYQPVNGRYPKPNPIQPTIFIPVAGVSTECRMEFTTRDKGNTATRIGALYGGGTPARNDAGTGYLDLADAHGVTVMSWADANSGAADVFTKVSYFGSQYRASTDIYVLPNGRLCDWKPDGVTPKGFMFMVDHEEQNGSTEDEFLAFVATLAGDIHGNGFLYGSYNNALNSAGAVRTGFGPNNLPLIHHNYIDRLCVLASSQSPEHNVITSIQNQEALLGPDPDFSRLLLLFEMGNPGLTLNDAQAVRDHITDGVHNYIGVDFWRNGATQGGPLSDTPNQQTCIMLGLPRT